MFHTAMLFLALTYCIEARTLFSFEFAFHTWIEKECI